MLVKYRRTQNKRWHGLKVTRRSKGLQCVKWRPGFMWKVTTLQVDRLQQDRQLDLIQRLNNRSLHNIVEKIFSYLDYESIVNAEQVSIEWQTVLDNERIWKALLERNVNSDRFWFSINYIIKKNMRIVETSSETIGFLSKGMCKQIGTIECETSQLMQTCLRLLSSNLRILAKFIRLFRIMGYHDISFDL